MGKITLGLVVLSGFTIFGVMIFKKNYSKSPVENVIFKPHIVIIAENNQKQLEGIVRLYYTYAQNTKDLWVVDRGSTDQTSKILEKLSTQFSGLNILLLPDVPIEDSVKEVMKYIKAPAVLFLDVNNLSFMEIINLIKGASSQKSVEIGLKTYTK